MVDESGKEHYALVQKLGSSLLQDSQQITVLQFLWIRSTLENFHEREHRVHKDDGFEADVLSADKPVLVDYWAEWCGPCKMIAPILDEIADEYSDRLKICKLDIDANQGTPPKYGIRGIPTLMLFKNGEVEATKVGALSKSQLQAFLDSNI